MPGVERSGDAATCEHTNSGSPNVFANSKGISRVGLDSAGGTINGPGSPTVFVNGARVSLPGDAIEGHGSGLHATPYTASPSTDVFAGDQE